MDRAIVIAVLLLVGLTWLLYELTKFLAPSGDKGSPAEPRPEEPAADNGRKLIHQRLRK